MRCWGKLVVSCEDDGYMAKGGNCDIYTPGFVYFCPSLLSNYSLL